MRVRVTDADSPSADEVVLRHPFLVSLLVCLLCSAIVGVSAAFVNAAALLWLPAGAGVVLSTVGGWRARVGVVAATLAVDVVWIPAQVVDTPAAVVAMLAGVAVTTWIWTGLCARILRPVLLDDRELTEPRELVRFVAALAVPGIFHGALTGVVLVAALDTPLTRALAIAALWWVGNTAGALLAAPLVAAFVCRPVAVWRRRRWPATGTLVLAWAMAVPVMASLEAGYVQRLEGRWREYSNALANRIHNTVENAAEITRGVASAIQATRDIAPFIKGERMTTFIESLRRPGDRIALLGWARRVESLERGRWENERQLVVRDLDANGRPVAAPLRDEHFPLAVVDGVGEAAAWAGLDIAGSPAARAHLGAVAISGTPGLFRAEPPLAAVGRDAVMLVMPVYDGATVPPDPAGRRAALRGVCVAVLDVGALLGDVRLQAGTSAARVEIVDATPGSGASIATRPLPIAVAGPTSRWLKRATPVEEVTESDLFGRRWRVATAGVLLTDAFEPLADWSVTLSLALFLGGVMQSLMLTLTGREAAVQRLVAQRTETLEVIHQVQGQYISGGQTGQTLDLEPVTRAIARSTGAWVELVEELGGPSPAPEGESPGPDARLVLRHGDENFGYFDLRGIRHHEGLGEARALAAASAALLASVRADAARHEAERRFDLFMAHLPIIAFIKSAQGRYLYVNPAFEGRFRGPEGSVVGRTDDQLWDAATAARLHALDAEALAAERAVEREEHLPGPGETSTWRLYVFAVSNPAGIRYVAGLGTDITAERRAADQVRASLREKEALLKEIHHRVKNNLQIVSSLLNLHRPQSDDPAVAAFVEESRNRIRSIALLHETLYLGGNLGRIDFGHYVRSLGAHLLRSFGPHAPGVALDIDVDEVELGLDQAIPCGLILNELVSNALKYAFPEGRRGRIAVAARPAPGGPLGLLSLVVADDGVGLADDYDAKLTRSLGLRLVFDLASQLGGSVTVTREGGTRAELRFPLARA